MERVPPLIFTHVPHIARGVPAKKVIGDDAGEECEPAKEEGVDEFVEVRPHVCFHPHHVPPSLGCPPLGRQMRISDQCDGEVWGEVQGFSRPIKEGE